jgi:hypothetical protein
LFFFGETLFDKFEINKKKISPSSLFFACLFICFCFEIEKFSQRRRRKKMQKIPSQYLEREHFFFLLPFKFCQK